MPLAFHSISHGQVAFGFFNIESDMLLLEHYFFFSTTFCEHILRMADNRSAEATPSSFSGYTIDKPENIGDLMGAIDGIHYTGFIGELYRRFPFPQNPTDFRQHPRGTDSQGAVSALIADYGRQTKIPFTWGDDKAVIGLGEYRFDRPTFHQLIDYVWRGGLPQWKDDLRPTHVTDMKNGALNSSKSLFKGIQFSPE